MAQARTALLALALAALAAAAPAQETNGMAGEAGEAPAAIPAALDPGAPAGAELTLRTDQPLARYALPVGPYASGEVRARSLEGRVIRSAWRLADPDATTASVLAGYRERLARLGYEPVFACADADCGGIDFRFAVELMPPPAMLVDAADFAQLSAKRKGPGGASGRSGGSYVSVLVSRLLGAVYAQTVAVAPTAEPGAAPRAAPGAAPETAPEPAPETAPVAEGAAPDLPEGAATLVKTLLAHGHARIDGLDFEVGSAALTAASGASIDRVAEVLSARPELRFLVVGHSDNQGSLADNMALSRRRAQAVREALVARGVDPARLEAAGAGFLAPVASNATEAGRARNRRVELVLQ